MFNLDQIVKALQTDPNTQRTAATGAAGLAAGLLLGGGGFGKVAKLGALAAVGGLAYQAWQNHQRSQMGTEGREGDFMPTSPEDKEELGKSLVRAMIAAAKADGRIDADEKDRIFKRLETMQLSAEDKAFVFDELSTPLSLDAVAARADTPEHAAEIYAASLVAIHSDTAAERAYLEALAARLKLEPALVAEIHRVAEGSARQDTEVPGGGFVPPAA